MADNKYENFETISVVNKGKYSTSLIQDPFSGAQYVKKELPKEKMRLYQTLQTIKHQGLSEIIEVVEKEHHITVIIEYAVGTTLKRILDDNVMLEERVAITYVQQLTSILNVVHQNGIIHRDITPNNIIVTPQAQVKLIDFDIARFYKNSQTEDTQLLGTPGYAAPEQFGFNQSTASSDIYALGVLLNVMITGMKPNEMLISQEGLAAIVKNCTAMDQTRRYQDVRQLDYDLRRLRLTVIDDDSSTENKTRGLLVKVAVAVCVLIFVFFAYFAFRYWHISAGDGAEIRREVDLSEVTIVPSVLSGLAPSLDTFVPAPEAIFTTLGDEDDLGGTFMYASGYLESWRSQGGTTVFYLSTADGMLAVVTFTPDTFETNFDFSHLEMGSDLQVYFIYHALSSPMGSRNGEPVNATGSIVGFIEF
ncbi:MAG: serine/threonine protein kinase [Turicibacter sp.]|nr:serine/threonine protein kinase [Turicibacter sp.]